MDFENTLSTEGVRLNHDFAKEFHKGETSSSRRGRRACPPTDVQSLDLPVQLEHDSRALTETFRA